VKYRGGSNMKLYKLNIKFIAAAIILSAAFLQNCADVPRDNAADRGGDNYNSVYADNRITSFSIVNPVVSGVINEAESKITVYVLYGTDVENLAAEFATNAESVTIYGREQRSGITVNDFSSPVYYEVMSKDGSYREYTVSVEPVMISAFSVSDPELPGGESVSGTIDYSNSTITVAIPYYMDKNSLVADFDVIGDISVNGTAQISGTTPNDFTGAVTYRVGDENGVMQDYTVTVNNKEGTVGHLAGSTGGYGGSDGTGSAAAFRWPFGIVCDSDYLYVADTSNHTIRKIGIITRIVTTLAGSPGQPGVADGAGKDARFNNPQGITTDGVNLYVADTGNHTIRKIVISTGVVTTIAGTVTAGAGVYGTDGDTDNDPDNITSKFNTPSGITIIGTDLYVADTFNSRIRKIEIPTGNVTVFAGYDGTDEQTGYVNSTTGPGTAARFNRPNDITTDGSSLFVADTNNHVIRSITVPGGAVYTFGPVNNFPSGITTDMKYLYVTGQNTIRRIDIAPPYTLTTIAGTAAGSDEGTNWGDDDGIGNAARFKYPSGITTDGTNLYVADRGNSTIRKIALFNKLVSTFAGSINESGIVDGTGADARLSSPYGLTVLGGYVYAAGGNPYIRKIDTSTGTVSTLNTISYFTPDSLATDGTYLYASDSTYGELYKIDVSGSIAEYTVMVNDLNSTGITICGNVIYAADVNNRRIQKIELVSPYAVTTFVTGPDSFRPIYLTNDGTSLYAGDSDTNYKIYRIPISTGEITDFAGSGSAGHADGIGDAASFNRPRSITTDGKNVYVADCDNNLIRKIRISTREVSTIAGSALIAGNTSGTGSAALFNSPFGITFCEADKKLYISDTYNNAVKAINP